VRAVFIQNMTSPRMAAILARETGAALGDSIFGRVVPSGRAGGYVRDDAAQHDAVRVGHAAGRLDRRATTIRLRIMPPPGPRPVRSQLRWHAIQMWP
jgi:hypothetical protein